MKTFYETHLRKVKYFLSHEPGFSALDVEYADVLADPETTARRIRIFLGAPLEVAGMTRVVDGQLYRNRQR